MWLYYTCSRWAGELAVMCTTILDWAAVAAGAGSSAMPRSRIGAACASLDLLAANSQSRHTRVVENIGVRFFFFDWNSKILSGKFS